MAGRPKRRPRRDVERRRHEAAPYYVRRAVRALREALSAEYGGNHRLLVVAGGEKLADE